MQEKNEKGILQKGIIQQNRKQFLIGQHLMMLQQKLIWEWV
jgi:hypothetical protein